MLSFSNYVASVDEDACIACTSSCDAEAVRLVLREEVTPLPTIMEFLEARMK